MLVSSVCFLLLLRRRDCRNPDCMNIGLHEFAERRINHPVALYAILARESSGNDSDVEMTQSVFGAFMSSVKVALILDLQFSRRECFAEQNLNALHSVAHGSTRLNGLTTVSW